VDAKKFLKEMYRDFPKQLYSFRVGDPFDFLGQG